MNLTYTLDGDSSHKSIGKKIVYRSNTGYSEQFWYTSHSGSRSIALNSIVFFKKSRNDYWEYVEDEDLLQLSGSDDRDYLVYDMYKDNMLYKLNDNTDLQTFLSCKYNFRYNTEEEEEDIELDNRNCTRCLVSAPFSYGFSEDEC